MEPLVLLHPDPKASRLWSALAQRYELVPCARWDRLMGIVASESLEGCVLDLPSQRLLARYVRLLRRLRFEYPALAIVVSPRSSTPAADVYELGRIGIDGLVPAGPGIEQPEIQRRVRRALAASLARRVSRASSSYVPPLVDDCVRWAVENAEVGVGPDALAGAVGLSTGILSRELKGLGMPSARRLLLIGRLVRAAHQLGSPLWTVEVVAYDLGYASGAGLARALREYTGVSPTEVVERGGAQFVLQVAMGRDLRPNGGIRRPTVPPLPH